MNRRDLITLIGGAAAWPVAARAQQPTMPVIGYLSSFTAESDAGNLASLRSGLSETGYVEGRNLAVEYRWAGGVSDRLPALAADLIQRRVALIFAGGNVAIHAAEAATRTIPIVFNTGDDPIATGIVPSLSRPGGNATGTSMTAGPLVTKRLQLLHEVAPAAATVGMLVNPDNANATGDAHNGELAAQALGLLLIVLKVARQSEIEPAFGALAEKGAGGLVVNTDAFLSSQRQQIAALSARYRIPSISSFRVFVDAGGLISYGPDVADSFRQAGIYAGRVLKGEKPSEMPVMQPTKFELAINLKTAKALGLTVPSSLLAIADEVIE
jgi:putative tryptophan/tyrosine transport system substrate-binding protein